MSLFINNIEQIHPLGRESFKGWTFPNKYLQQVPRRNVMKHQHLDETQEIFAVGTGDSCNLKPVCYSQRKRIEKHIYRFTTFQHDQTGKKNMTGRFICIVLISMSYYALVFNRTDPKNKQTCW